MGVKSLFEKTSATRGAARRASFEAAVRIVPGWKILDIGCRESFRSPWLSRDLDGTGIDLRAIKKDQWPYDKFVCCDATDLPFADQSFDLAFSNSLIRAPTEPRTDTQIRFGS